MLYLLVIFGVPVTMFLAPYVFNKSPDKKIVRCSVMNRNIIP